MRVALASRLAANVSSRTQEDTGRALVQAAAMTVRYHSTAERPTLEMWLIDDDGSLIDFIA